MWLNGWALPVTHLYSQSSIGRALQAGAITHSWLLSKIWAGENTYYWDLLVYNFKCGGDIGDKHTIILYYILHSHAHSFVEHCIGLFTGRVLCLDESGNRLSARKVCKIIWACAVLHNAAQKNGFPFPPEHLRPDDRENHGVPHEQTQTTNDLCLNVVRQLNVSTFSCVNQSIIEKKGSNTHKKTILLNCYLHRT